jgi:hypothetical protein
MLRVDNQNLYNDIGLRPHLKGGGAGRHKVIAIVSEVNTFAGMVLALAT